MYCLISRGVKFPHLIIVPDIDRESTVATAVARFVRLIVLLFVDIFKLYNFTGSTMLLLHVES